MSKMGEIINKWMEDYPTCVRSYKAGWQAHAENQWVTVTDNPETWPIKWQLILAFYVYKGVEENRFFRWGGEGRPASMVRWIYIPEYKEPK